MWGWMPCGLVYSALGYAAATGSWRDGAMYMFAFGAGTLPAMTGLGLFSNLSSRLQRHRRWRQAAGAALIVIAAITLVIQLAPYSHDHSQASPETPADASAHGIHHGHQ
jgi:sulfite exporter TauE/SafE